jgi:Flp pilus assembly protein TadB
MTALLVAVIAGCAAFGALLMLSAWSPGRPRSPGQSRVAFRDVTRPMLMAVVVGGLVFAATGWAVAGIGGGIAGVAALRAWDRRGTRGHRFEQARIEALAGWCEQLRALLSADHGIVGTIDATVRTCPDAIRPEVTALSVRLSRLSAPEAVGRFADEMDDPSADLVASVILLAMSRSSRTAEMLTELAAPIRERASMRLRVEAERAGARGEARFVIAFTAIVIIGVLTFGRDSEFLDAYDDASGQAMLALVVLFFVFGGRWLARLTRFERPARFLSVTVDEPSQAASS